MQLCQQHRQYSWKIIQKLLEFSIQIWVLFGVLLSGQDNQHLCLNTGEWRFIRTPTSAVFERNVYILTIQTPKITVNISALNCNSLTYSTN